MKNKINKPCWLVLLLLVITFNTQATIYRLGFPGNPVAGFDFAWNDVNTLMATTIANDTIHVYQQYATTGITLNIDKPLALFGYGYLLNKNAALQVVNIPDTANNAVVIYLNAGADGTTIQGLHANIQMYDVNNITIKRCKLIEINLLNGVALNNIQILDNISTTAYGPTFGFPIRANYSYEPLTNLKCVNNQMGSIVLRNGSTGTIANNVFMPTSISYTSGTSFVQVNNGGSPSSNVLIKNNIVTDNTYTGCFFDPSGNIGLVKNNVFAYPNTACTSQIGNSNLFNVNMNTTFTNWNSGNIYSDGQLTLATGASALTAGRNNANAVTQAGLFGGETAELYKLSGIPDMPSIYTNTFPTSLPNNNSNYAGLISTRSNTTSNITRIEYYIDNDPGYGLGTPATAFTASSNVVNKSISMNVSALAVGYHYLVIRSRDAAGRWSLNNIRAIYKSPANPATTTLQNISRIEYFIDTDPGIGVATNLPVTAATDITTVLAYNPTSLAAGVHSIGIRARDAVGKWSLINRKIFYKPYNYTSTPTTLPNLSHIEYFMDTDPGEGLATNVNFTAGTNVNSLVIPFDPTNITAGVHRFSVRAKDATGSWSLMNTTQFYKPYNYTSTPTTFPDLSRIEYFMDTDPGEGLATNVNFTAGTDVNSLVIPFNPTTITAGVHRFSVRAKDANGAWSLLNTTLYYKPYDFSSTPATTPALTKLEYFIDTDPGEGLATELTIPTGTQLNNFIAPIDIYSLCNGPHRVIVRAKDANGAWSLLNQMDFVKGSTNFTVVNIKAFMEGYYTGNGHMAPVLLNQGISSSLNVTDTVEIELHNATYPFGLAYTFKGIMNVVGEIACMFPLSINQQSYYISVKHRNSIETWSSNPITIDACTLYDFTNSNGQAYGSNEKHVGNGVFAMFSGDIDQDGSISTNDYAIWENDANNFEAGYRATDLDGDGGVTTNDYSIWEQNSNNFVGVVKP